MKPEIIILVGPPASGKSTYAKNLMTDRCAIISQDNMGKLGHLEAFHNHLHGKFDLIIDRMNFNKEQRARYIKLAKEAGYTTKIIVLHESKETCIKQGLNRLNAEEHPTIKTEQDLRRAIDFFFSHYERPTDDEADTVEFVYPKQTMKLNGIICDLDGTLCNIDHRLHFVRQEGKKDWKNFMLPQNVEQDGLNKWCRDVVHGLRSNNVIVMCSGRPDSLMPTTKEWLEKHKVMHDHLFMRPRSDHRQDAIIKEIILDFEILTRMTPVLAIDDRSQVVDMWRKRGITTLQCAPGDF